MTHDLKTPLNGIKCLIDILKDGETSNNKLEHLNLMQKSAIHLSNIIENILNFSAFETGKVAINNENLSLKKYFYDLKNIHKVNSDQKGIEFNVISPDIFIKIDKFLLDQILMNLVGNAIKFTFKGFVRIDTSYQHIDNSTYSLKIVVKDSGIGIFKQKINKIFNDFYRAVDNRNSNIPGSGLGLNITKRAIEIMGGTLNVKSKLGIGSEFTVKLNCEIGDNIPEQKKLKNRLIIIMQIYTL
jgi:signal transduction histidine kinase